MELIYVDGRDAEIFERFFRVKDEVRRGQQEFPVGLGPAEARPLMTEEHVDLRADGLAIVDGDDWLGVAWLDWYLQENTHLLEVEIAVDPVHRRTGVGTKLLEAAAERARASGRRLLTGSIIGDAATGESAGTAFATAHGFVRKHEELHQILELPVDPMVAVQRDGYEFVQWRDQIPDEWLEQMAAALQGASRDIPHGELDQQVQQWTPERVREVEARRLKQGRFCYTTIAVTAEGKLAAYTEMGGTPEIPDRLYQWGTFVWPEHRGKGLGMAVKIPNLRSLQDGLAGSAVLHTWNAPENAPMIRVNDQVGFRAVDRRSSWERAV
ncbi:GNAT family N-acetyltransferase [Kribbella sp. NPDC006257]|uniref:GNAT family N-acetyltransferase n=1 Tax=Kribbella sp. NPDC006257 TaxID=3156738 RepID=UPI0033ADB47C